MIKKRANTHSTIKLKSLDRQPNPTEKEAARSHCRYAHGMTQPSLAATNSTAVATALEMINRF